MAKYSAFFNMIVLLNGKWFCHFPNCKLLESGKILPYRIGKKFVSKCGREHFMHIVGDISYIMNLNYCVWCLVNVLLKCQTHTLCVHTQVSSVQHMYFLNLEVAMQYRHWLHSAYLLSFFAFKLSHLINYSVHHSAYGIFWNPGAQTLLEHPIYLLFTANVSLSLNISNLFFSRLFHTLDWWAFSVLLN